MPSEGLHLTFDRFEPMLELLSLSPHHLAASLVMLGSVVLVNDLVRTCLMVSFTRSVIAHLTVIVLTLFPAMLLGAVLLVGGFRYPDRALLNLGLALLLYVPWYVGGALTRLARPDTEAADVGFMAVGLLITLPCGLLALLF